MSLAITLATFGLGLTATPHCALMCGAPCAALTGGRRDDGAVFQLARLAGYAAGGALAAAGVGAIGAWARTTPLLQPAWTLLQLAFLALGLWWLATGRMPARLLRDGAVPVIVVPRRRAVARAAFAGFAWIGWPCPALQGALIVSALAGGSAGGALAMAAFALASMPGLLLAPSIWAWWSRVAGGRCTRAGVASAGWRIAGVALAASSAWALAMTLHERLAALCVA